MGILVDLAAFRTRRAERAARAVAAPKDPMAEARPGAIWISTVPSLDGGTSKRKK